MKKRIISLLVVVALVLSSNIMSYAEISQLNIKDLTFNQERSNRYYYKTVYVPMDEPDLEFSITEEEASTIQMYDELIKAAIQQCFEFFGEEMGVLYACADFMIGKYYHSPFDAAGDYTLTRLSARRIRVDRLTGKQRIVRRGYKIKTFLEGLDGSSSSHSRVFWIK